MLSVKIEPLPAQGRRARNLVALKMKATTSLRQQWLSTRKGVFFLRAQSPATVSPPSLPPCAASDTVVSGLAGLFAAFWASVVLWDTVGGK